MATLFTKIDGEQDYTTTPFEFDYIGEGGSSTFAPSTSAYYAGTRGYRALWDGSNVNTNGEAIFAGDESEVYLKFRVRISTGYTLPAQYNRVRIASINIDRFSAVQAVELFIFAGGSATVDSWRIAGAGITAANSSTNFSLNAWHEIEMYFNRGVLEENDGVAKITIDGDDIFDLSSLDNDANDADRVVIGSASGHVPSNGVYIDYDEIEGHDAVPSSVSDSASPSNSPSSSPTPSDSASPSNSPSDSPSSSASNSPSSSASNSPSSSPTPSDSASPSPSSSPSSSPSPSAGFNDCNWSRDNITALIASITALQADITAIKAVTDNIATESELADSVLDEVVEGTYSLRQMIRGIFSALAGLKTGNNFRDVADTKNRIAATVVTNDRTVVTLDLD